MTMNGHPSAADAPNLATQMPPKDRIAVNAPLSVVDVEVILTGLQELPFKQVAGLFQRLTDAAMGAMQAEANKIAERAADLAKRAEEAEERARDVATGDYDRPPHPVTIDEDDTRPRRAKFGN